MMRKITVLCIAVWIICLLASTLGMAQTPNKGREQTATEKLKTLLEEGKFDELAPLFLDHSYEKLKKYFSRCLSLKIITSELNDITYKAKFPRKGEIGIIAFEEKDGKLLKINLKNQIKPLYFIEKFKKYKVRDLKISIGNARLHFKKGYFYETFPFRSLLIFDGQWNFYIRPNDEEEQLTLKRQYKRDFFTTDSDMGVFILPNKSFLKKIPLEEEVTGLRKPIQALYNAYRNAYGVHIKQFDEYWYLPFPDESNVVIFKKDKKSFYYYSFNRNIIPDTQFAVSGSNQLILSYNCRKGMKLNFISPEKVAELNLNLFVNPLENLISGTAFIAYDNKSNLRVIDLAPGMKLVGNLESDGKGMNVFRKNDKYYLMGSESQKLSLYFNGKIASNPEDFELFRTKSDYQISEEKAMKDVFQFYSRTQNFYPNPGTDFYKSDLSITVPGNFNCIAVGNLVNKKEGENSVYTYASNYTKGVSMVIGNFKLGMRIDSKIPINIYTPVSLGMPDELDIEEIKNAANFLYETYGSVDLSELNIVLNEGSKDGGLSNRGFVIVYMPFRKNKMQTDLFVNTITGPRGNQRIHSPILIREKPEDHIIHELAHQWWGGVISWTNYQDIWMTEGLAHFSVLYYLKKNMSERSFLRLIRKLKDWVFQYSNSGPIIYGNRIFMLENNYEAYQSVIYNKTALVFMMLMDMIGEKDFMERLNSTLAKFKYRSITSMQFIREFSGDNQQIFKFFESWIYRRVIPQVELTLLKDHADYDLQDMKKVVLSIKQVNTDFIFPLQLDVTTLKGTSTESLFMDEKEKIIVITRDSTIRTIDVRDSFPLVKGR